MAKYFNFCQKCLNFAVAIEKDVSMKITEYVARWGATQQKPFRRQDLLQQMQQQNMSVSSVDKALQRMCANGMLERASYGWYSLPQMQKRTFVYNPMAKEKFFAIQIRAKFPFADFCIWNPTVLIPYMRHVPVLNIILVDVEKDAAESVFLFLREFILNEFQDPLNIFLNPTKLECERYIASGSIIVRTLINEAPVVSEDSFFVPTLEKILVDIVGDKELLFAQGAEMYTIYENAFQMHPVNVRRLLRYAARRNRKERITKILKTLGL